MIKYIILFFLPISLLAQKVDNFKVYHIGQENLKVRFELDDNVDIELSEYYSKKITHNFKSTHKKGIHDIYFNGLKPAELYNLTISGNKKSQTFVVVTESESTGEISIVFNKDANKSFSDGSYANGYDGKAIEKEILAVINNAKSTLDVFAYNTNRKIFVKSLVKAHERGVRVRFIADKQQNNYALSDPVPFEILFDAPENGIMHNKILIADAKDMQKATVLTGATNFTTGQIFHDPNHIVVIEDKSIAQAYTIEFNEMWGGNGKKPNYTKSKFGTEKKDNTPHFFKVGGVPTEVYFSPSDKADSKVINEIKNADEELLCGLLLFTRKQIKDVIVDNFNSMKDYRIIIEDPESSAELIGDLEEENIPYSVHDHDAIFHHKYGVIDEGGSDPTVITGSMNWTYSGGYKNDENTIIFRDQSIANIFKQDFEKQWSEFVSNEESLAKKHDIKVKDQINSLYVTADYNITELMIYNASGSKMASAKGKYISTSDLARGYYVLMIKGDEHKVPYKFTKK